MVHVTLVGLKQAKKDMVFVFKGPLLECRDCKYKQVCFNLEEGKRYKVTAIRDATHECEIHEGGVRAVEVEVIPFEGAISGRMVLEGSIVPLDDKGCGNRGCPHFRMCHPPDKKIGNKFKIIKVLGAVECPEDRRVTKCLLED